MNYTHIWSPKRESIESELQSVKFDWNLENDNTVMQE